MKITVTLTRWDEYSTRISFGRDFGCILVLLEA